MRLTKFNPETGQYEYIEPARTQEEFIAQRKAVIQRLGEYEDKGEVVRCKDCTEWDEKEQECSHWYGFRENDYCSFGERRENGT